MYANVADCDSNTVENTDDFDNKEDSAAMEFAALAFDSLNWKAA